MRLALVVLALAVGFPSTLVGQDISIRSLLEQAAAALASGPAAALSDEQLVSDVEALIARRLQEPTAVGLSVAIARGGELILAGGYGRADVELDVAADADTSFRIGSVTKPFTAAAILRLVEQGELALDDDLQDYLPDFPTQGRKVSIRHLLTHTSGIESFTSVAEFWKTGAARELSADELLAYVEDLDLEFEPGDEYAYSNTGYYLLGRIIEEVSASSYCQFVQDEFFAPLGLSRTRCDSNAEIIPNRAQGYGVVEGRIVNDAVVGMSNPGGAGRLMATARDLVSWSQALFGGEVLSVESLEQMITPAILNGGESTGYGFGLNPGGFDGRPTIGHSGGVSGFSAMLVHFPDDDLHIAVISNIEGGLRAQSMAQDIARLAFGTYQPVLDLPLSASELSLFSGTYNLTRVNHDVTIFAEDGSLFIHPAGRSASRLLHQGGGEFRAEDDLDSKIVFDAEQGAQFVLIQSGLRLQALRQSREG